MEFLSVEQIDSILQHLKQILIFEQIDKDVYSVLKQYTYDPDRWKGNCHKDDWIMLDRNEDFDFIYPFTLIVVSELYPNYRTAFNLWMDDDSKTHRCEFLKSICPEIRQSVFKLNVEHYRRPNRMIQR